MNPSPQAIAWIRAHADFSGSDGAAAAALNAQAAANPVATAPRLPAPCYPSAVLGLLSPASLAKVDASNFAGRLYDSMQAGDAPAVGRWAGYYAALGSITPQESAAIVAYLQSTVADPSWTATLPAPVVAMGRTLDADDIAASRPTGG